MKYRIPLAAAAVTAVLLATGLAWANGSDDSSTSSSTTSSTSTTSTSSRVTTAPAPTATNPIVATTAASIGETNSTASIPDGTSQTFAIGNAGTVLLGRSGGSLQIIAATPNAGWASEVEVASGREVEGDFRNGPLRVKYNFEVEDGTVRVRIENRPDNVDGDDDGVNDDQRGDDDDNSGSASGDGDDDNSGPGSDDGDNDDSSGHGGDDHGDHDDDTSGPGSGDDDSDDDD